LSSSIGFSGPVGREFEFMPVRKHRNQGVRGMIGGDHDEAATRQNLSQNCVDGGTTLEPCSRRTTGKGPPSAMGARSLACVRTRRWKRFVAPLDSSLLVVHGRTFELFALGIGSARDHRPALAVDG
jgi:hypothetical protein